MSTEKNVNLLLKDFPIRNTPHKRYYEQLDGKNTDITDEIPFALPDG